MLMKHWKGLLAFIFSLAYIGLAIAGSGTIAVKDGGGVSRTYDVVTDGSGNYVAMNVICDYVAAANCTTVNASHQMGVVEANSAAILSAVTGSIPAGAAIIGKVGVDQTTPGTTNGTAIVGVNAATALAGTGAVGTGSLRVAVGTDTATIAGSAPGTAGSASTNVISVQGVALMTPVLTTSTLVTSGGYTTYFVQPTASDNHVVVKAGAGQVYWVLAENNSATVNYLRFYNATTGFNGCNSATNLVSQIQIPASTAVGGINVALPYGIPFSTGISICVTSGYATTDTTNATATAISLTIGYN